MANHDAGPSFIRPAIPEAILRTAVIAIARGLPADRLIRIGEGLADGGVGAFEVTLNSPGALAGIAALVARFGPEELLIGAGTVLSPDAARAAADAGAAFIVTPVMDRAVIGAALERGIPCIPGAFSPTEVLAAWQAGASAVKLFPASSVGPSFIRELHGPLPEIRIIPTGGMTIETAPGFIAAGAVAIGIGSWLTGDGDPVGIGERGARLVAAVRRGSAPDGSTGGAAARDI